MNTELESIISKWDKEPRESAERLIKEYGEPDEVSPSGMIWYDTKDGWKRSVLTNDPTEHHFPDTHNDFLEQFINYRVPVDKFTPLAGYDGSVNIDRTRGEMSARCGGTSMNFVAINLAHDIITGKRTVQEARREYTRLYQAYKNGEHPDYTKKFIFDLPVGNTGDPDVKTIGASA
jgi:hypothetical protein